MHIDRTQAPKPSAPRDFRFPDFTRFYLDNGLEVLVVEQKKFPLVSVNLCLQTSALFDPQGKEGLANFVSEMLAEGTETRSSTQLADELEFIAAQFSSHADWNAIHLNMNTLSRNMEAAMDLFTDILLHPVFPEEEADRIRKEMLIDRMRIVDIPSRLTAEQFVHFLYHPMRYAIPIEGTETSLPHISTTDMKSFYRSVFVPSNATLILVGNISESRARELSARFLSSWKAQPKPVEPQLSFSQPEQTRVRLIHKPGSAQTELRMGHLGIERSNPDYYAVTLLNEILGGYFLSRINMNLREKHGYTYGAGSSFSFRKGIGPFLVSGAIQIEHTTAAIQEIINELRYIRSDKVSEKELEHARGRLNGLFPITFETSDHIAKGLSNITTYGLADDYYNTFRDHLTAVTREDILHAAQSYLLPEQLEIVVTADRSQVEKQLRAVFPVHVYDVNGHPLS